MKDFTMFLDHIIEAMELAMKYLEEINRKTFLSDNMLQDAVIRRLEIIGEAAKNVPLDIKDKFTEIPWKQMAGMRDILIHAYFGVDLNQTYQVCKKDIPVILPSVKKAREDIRK